MRSLISDAKDQFGTDLGLKVASFRWRYEDELNEFDTWDFSRALDCILDLTKPLEPFNEVYIKNITYSVRLEPNDLWLDTGANQEKPGTEFTIYMLLDTKNDGNEFYNNNLIPTWPGMGYPDKDANVLLDPNRFRVLHKKQFFIPRTVVKTTRTANPAEYGGVDTYDVLTNTVLHVPGVTISGTSTIGIDPNVTTGWATADPAFSTDTIPPVQGKAEINHYMTSGHEIIKRWDTDIDDKPNAMSRGCIVQPNHTFTLEVDEIFQPGLKTEGRFFLQFLNTIRFAMVHNTLPTWGFVGYDAFISVSMQYKIE